MGNKLVVMVGLGESWWGLTVEQEEIPAVGFQGLLKEMTVEEEEIERLEMEVGCWIRLVEHLNSQEEEEKGFQLMLAAESWLSLPVEDLKLEAEWRLMVVEAKVAEEEVNLEEEVTVVDQRVAAVMSQTVEEEKSPAGELNRLVVLAVKKPGNRRSLTFIFYIIICRNNIQNIMI